MSESGVLGRKNNFVCGGRMENQLLKGGGVEGLQI
jgi:hypothetical protein